MTSDNIDKLRERLRAAMFEAEVDKEMFNATVDISIASRSEPDTRKPTKDELMSVTVRKIANWDELREARGLLFRAMFYGESK